MPIEYYLVPAITDGTGNLRPKYSEAAGIDRFNAFICGPATTEEMVPLIAVRLGVTEQQVRNNLPTGQLYIVRLNADQSVHDAAQAQSDVVHLTIDEVVAALNLRFGVNRTAQEWAALIKDKVEEGAIKLWTPPTLNLDNVDHAEVRSRVDEQSVVLHNTLTEAYYGGTEFIWNGQNYGVLTKAEFDYIHAYASGPIQLLAFHSANIELDTQGVITKIDENEYRFGEIRDDQGNLIDTVDRVQEALDEKQKLLDEGFDLDLTLNHPDYGTIIV